MPAKYQDLNSRNSFKAERQSIGLALDAESNLYIAYTGFGSVWRLSRVGEPLQRIISSEGISNRKCMTSWA